MPLWMLKYNDEKTNVSERTRFDSLNCTCTLKRMKEEKLEDLLRHLAHTTHVLMTPKKLAHFEFTPFICLLSIFPSLLTISRHTFSWPLTTPSPLALFGPLTTNDKRW